MGDIGTIFKTIDGGVTWNSQFSGTTHWLSSVFFIDEVNGYIVGNGGTILKTTDGGITWNNQPSGTNELLKSVYFTDAYNGFAVGWNGTFLKTTDGGITWNNLSLETSKWLRSVYFIDANNGYTVGSYDYWNDFSQLLLKTTDGGTTWESESSRTNEALFSIYITDENTGFTVGENGTILKNSDIVVGMNEKQQNSRLKIYPNPASEKIKIQLSGSSRKVTGIVSVLGVMGQPLIQQQIQGTQIEINIRSLPAGLFFVKYISEGITDIEKFVKY